MKKEEVQKFYDIVWTEYMPEFEESKRHLNIFFNENEIKNKKILDCGCGTGIFSNIFASLGAEKVIGLDISQGSLNTANALKNKLQLNNLEFQLGDMLELPFQQNYFDIVWAWGSIHHTEDPLKALEEIDRVLKNDGILLIALYKKTKLTWIHEIARKLLIKTPKKTWIPLSKTLAFFLFPIVKFKEIFRKKSRKGEKLEELILDWFFVPIRHYFKPNYIRELLTNKGYKIIQYLPGSGRFESSSNFIFKTVKQK